MDINCFCFLFIIFFFYVAISPQLPWSQSRFFKCLSGYYNSSSRTIGDKLLFTIDSSHANFSLKPEPRTNWIVLRLSSHSAASNLNRTLTLLQRVLASPPADTSTWREKDRERGKLIVAGRSSSSLLAITKPQTAPQWRELLYHMCLLQDRKKQTLEKKTKNKLGLALSVV